MKHYILAESLMATGTAFAFVGTVAAAFGSPAWASLTALAVLCIVAGWGIVWFR